MAKRCPLPTPLASESFKASHQLYNFSPGWKSLQVVVSSFRNWKLVGREVGGEFRMGNTCIPVADSFRYLENQYNIVKFKNKIKFKKIK